MKHFERFSVYMIRQEDASKSGVRTTIHKTFMRLEDALDDIRRNAEAFGAEVNEKNPERASTSYRMEEFDTTITLTIEKIPVLY